MKKTIIVFSLFIMLSFTLLVPAQAQGEIGTIANYVLSTEITAYINGNQIPSYNINGYTAVISADLRNYGFSVVWDGINKTSTISLNNNGAITPLPIQPKSSLPVGSQVMPVYYTDIKSYINGVEIPSFNVGGKMIIYFRDLAVFGSYAYDNSTKSSKLLIANTTVNPPVNNEKILSPVEIGELADAVVMLQINSYDGSMSSGSGFYINKEGYLVTNYHVVDGAKEITIIHNDNSKYTGNVRVIGYDKLLDIAILDADVNPPLYLTLGDSNAVKMGEDVYAIGCPYGLTNTLSSGIISSVRSDSIQITAAISSGSSGGVLLNNKGKVIGITSAGIIEGENLGFAIPINELSKVKQKFNLSLADFYNINLPLAKPTGVTLKQMSGNSISIYWNKVQQAEYYKVYITDTIGGKFSIIYDSSGSDKFYWHEGVCLEQTGIVQGKTYYVKVTAVRGAEETEPSDMAYITIGTTNNTQLTYDQYENYILTTYRNTYINGYNFSIDYVYIDNLGSYTDELFVVLFIDNNTMVDFLNGIIANYKTLEPILSNIGFDISDYYKKNVSISLVYMDSWYEYPSSLVKNNLYDNTVKYNSNTGLWDIYYPYIQIYCNYYTQKYTVYWDHF